MAITKTRTTTVSFFSSTTATKRNFLIPLEGASPIDHEEVTSTGHHGGVVRIKQVLPSHKKTKFLALFTIALMACITSIRYGFLQEITTRDPYYYYSSFLFSRVTTTASNRSLSKETGISVAGGSTTSNLTAYDEYQGPTRVWEPFNGVGSFPCYHPGEERRLMSTEPAHRGLLFHRPHKVGSTTMVGIILRLVHNKARQQLQQLQKFQQMTSTTTTMQKKNVDDDNDTPGPFNHKWCLHRAIHGSVLHFEYHQRDISNSFLFSLLRHPTQRAISEFFHFRVATLGQEPTDANFLRFLRRKNGMRNYYLNDMTMKEFDNDNTTTGYGPHVTPLPTIVHDILNSFDFMAITERMNESLVVLQMLLGLETKDIVYTSARTSGTFSNGPPERPCTYIIPSFLTPGIQAFLASDEWSNIARGDLLLYNAASASLDRTIDALGRDEFEEKLQVLEGALIVVQEHCKQGDRVVTLCTEGGRRIAPQNTTCYIWSEGCDHDCIDELGDI